MNEYIYHYNHNHDPRNGQFTSNSNGSVVSSSDSKKKYITEEVKTKELESKIQEVTKNAKPDSKTVKLYKNAGLSQKDAEEAALRKKKIALIVGVTAGVALTAVAGYAIYKHYNNPLLHDLTLRKGLKMQTLSELADRTSNGDPFFASITSRDNADYITKFGKAANNIDNKTKIINTLNKSNEKTF